VPAIPRLINGYDEQAHGSRAAPARRRPADCRIVAVSIGRRSAAMLKHCAALGADEIVAIDADPAASSTAPRGGERACRLHPLSSGGADLVLCGRQASDDDQGVVPLLLGEKLGMPVVAPIARASERSRTARPARHARDARTATKWCEGALPAVVTISNELGEPRFPSARDKMAARKKQPEQIALSVADLGLHERTTARRGVQCSPSSTCPRVHGTLRVHRGHAGRGGRRTVRQKLRADKLI
jgi:electron transfer flavoprotein beta subunit